MSRLNMQRPDTPTEQPPSDHDERERSPEQQHEDQVVEEKAAVGSHIVYKAIKKVADEELNGDRASRWRSAGWRRGLSMGFSLVAEGLLRSKLPDTCRGGR